MHKVERMLNGKMLSIETGRVAKQADGSVLVRFGDTVILAAATMSNNPREGVDFFPLTVDFEERMYAAGKIPGGYIKREGRPSERAILSARMTDRPIRPLFPKNFRNEVQIIILTLSADQENQPDVLGTIGASAALSISRIPFQGPVGSVRVGRINGEFILNPTYPQMAESDLDLIVAGTREGVIMMEAGAKEIPEEVMVEAVAFGEKGILQMIELQEELVRRNIMLPVIIITGHGEVPLAVRAMAAGAVDFIEKPFDDQRMLDSVSRALQIGHQKRDRAGAAQAAQALLALLTPRERDVFDHLVEGSPNKIVGHELGISSRTVEIHRAKIMSKLQARNLSDIVRIALAADGS